MSATITTEMIKELRAKTQAGIMDCKKALLESEGDIEKAVEILRKKGLAQAAKKAGRETREGLVSSYIHSNGKMGVLIEVNCETDFVARTEEFQKLVQELAMQVAASQPQYVSIESVPTEIIEKEKEIYREQLRESGKPEQVIEKIIEGKLKKFYEENVLLEQEYIRDEDKKVKDLIAETVAKLGENIQVRRFARFAIGE